MTQGERVKEIRKYLNLTLEKFGEKLGVGKTAISKIEKNERSLTDQMAKSICREFNVNEHWLRTGEGDMRLPPDRKTEITRFMNQLQQEDDHSFKNRLVSVLADLKEEEWEFLERRMEQLYGGTAAAIQEAVETQEPEDDGADADKKTVLKTVPKADRYTTSGTGNDEKAVG
nr:helix-turn-helix transcriptional regulator [uncultured Acetatifactor sp.]